MIQLKSQQQQEAEAISYEHEANAPPARTPEPEITTQQPAMEQPGGRYRHCTQLSVLMMALHH
jgi:hypothetical protein